MADFDAGSIQARLTLDRSDFITGLREAQAQGANFDRKHYTATVDADTKQLNKKVGDANKQMNLLRTAIIALAPAAVPIAAAAVATAGSFAVMGGAGIAAIKGIQAEMKKGTDLGRTYAAGIDQLQTSFAQLEHTAAASLLGSFQKAVVDVNQEMPEMNSEVKLFSSILGASLENALVGSVSMLHTMLPLLTDVGLGFEGLTEHFRAWASTSGGLQNWVDYAHQVLPEVASDLGTLVGAVGHLVAAMAPMGVASLSAFGTLARLINAIPINVLQVLIPLITNAYLAFKSYTILTTIAAKFDNFANKLRGVGAAATESAAVQVAADAEAATAYEAATDAIVASAAERTAATTGAGAAGARAGLLGGAGAAGLLGGPVGIAIAGVTTALSLGMTAWDLYKTHVENSKKAVEDITTALEQSRGAIDTNVIESVDKVLKSSGGFSAAAKAGINLDLMSQAAVGNKDAMAQLVAGQSNAKKSLDDLRASYEELNKEGFGLGVTMDDQHRAAMLAAINNYDNWTKAVKSAQKGLKDFETAVHNQEQQQIEANRIQQLSQGILAQQPATATATKTALAGLAAQYGMTEAEGQSFATMAGLSKDKLDAGNVTIGQLNTSLNALAVAYGSANEAGSAFLSALSTFAESAGTAADKAALIGAALVAAQGDALGYAGSVANAYDATRQLITGFDKQEKAAIDLNTGLINVSKAGAPQLISQLQAMQVAAEKAAEATYQHEISTKGAGQAAADAATIFKTQTYDALVNNAKQLGLTADQAKNLATQYFNIPTDVTTTIKDVGTQTVIQTLNEIGSLLAKQTGQPWVSTLDVDDEASPKVRAVQSEIDSLHGKDVTIGITEIATLVGSGAAQNYVSRVPMRASGGRVSGPGTSTSDSILARVSNGEFVVNSQATSKYLGLLEAINSQKFAGGGLVTSGTGASFTTSSGPIDLGTAGSAAQKRAQDSLKQAVKDATEAAKQAQDAIVAHDDLLAAQALAAIDPTNQLALAQEAVADATRRLNNETKAGTTEYYQDLTKLHQAQAQVTQAQEEIQQKQQQLIQQFEQHQQDIANAQKTLANDYRAYTDLIKQEEDRTKQLYADIDAAAQQHATNVKQLMDQRQNELESSLNISQKTVMDYGQPIFYLISNTQDQITQFQQWTQQLADVRKRGVSEAVIQALGLDKGPQALGQLEQFSVATQQQIDDLNQAVAQKNQLAGQQVNVEATQSFSALGQALLAEQQQYAQAVLALQQQFQTDMANLAKEAQQQQQQIHTDLQNVTNLQYQQIGTAAYLQSVPPGTALYIQEPDGSYYHLSPAQYNDLKQNHPLTPIYEQYPSLTFDSGGYLPPGFSMAYNGTGQPERVVSPSESAGTIHVRVFIGDQELTHIVRTEVDNGFSDALLTYQAGAH